MVKTTEEMINEFFPSLCKRKALELIKKAKKGDTIYWNEAIEVVKNLGNSPALKINKRGRGD